MRDVRGMASVIMVVVLGSPDIDGFNLKMDAVHRLAEVSVWSQRGNGVRREMTRGWPWEALSPTYVNEVLRDEVKAICESVRWPG